MRSLPAAWFAITLFLGCECRPPDASSIALEPIRAPTVIEFPDTWVGFSSEQALVLTNPGRTQRTVSLETLAPFEGPVEVTLEGGEEQRITLQFSPSEPAQAVGLLVLREAGQSAIEVALRGLGLQVPPCALPEACRSFRFDPDAGECVARSAEDGTTCASLACFTSAQCLSGECVGGAVTCADQNLCTLDVCSAVGCGQVDRTPYCPRSQTPCLVPMCDVDAGCGFVEAMDGTSCGERTCTTARVCVAGACVTRVPPRNQSCADVIVGVPAGSGSNDGLGNEARFLSLRSIALQGDDAVVVDGTRLRRVGRDGSVTSIAGQFDSPGRVDGFGTAVRLGTGAVVAPSTSTGTFFVGDGNTIRLASIAGLVTTLAGRPDAGGIVDGVGAAAQLNVGSQMVLTRQGRALFLQFENTPLQMPPRFALREVSLQGEVRTIARISTDGFPGFDSTELWRASGHIVDTGDDSVHLRINLTSRVGGRTAFWALQVFGDEGSIIGPEANYLLQSWRRGSGRVSLEPCAVLFESDAGFARTGLDCVSAGALDRDGGLWVVGAARVQLASASGRHTLAGADPDRRIVDGSRDGGRLSWPRSLTQADAGLFLLDGPEGNGTPYRVRRLDTSGRLQTVDAGFFDLVSVVPLSGTVAAIAPSGRTTLIDPPTLTVLETRQLVSGLGNGVASSGTELRGIWPAMPVLTFDGGATPSTAAFVSVSDVAAAPGGTWVVVGETDPTATARARLFSLDAAGTATLLAGVPTLDGEVDGPALQAQLGGIARVAVASDGTIYFSSYRSNRIRQLRAGQVTTVIELADTVLGLTAMPDGSLIVAVDAALLRVFP